MRTIVVSIIFVVCGILGFLCQMLYANYFGSGKEMDIYFSLLSIPAIITGATGTIFSSLFFPAFSRLEKENLDGYIYKIKTYVSKIALTIAIIGFLVTYFNLRSIIDTNEVSYYNLSLALCALFWLNGYISIVNGYLASVQNYFRNFLIVSSTQLLAYLCIILFVVLFNNILGVRSIALGMLCASIISLIINRFYGGVFQKKYNTVRIEAIRLFSNICMIIISFLPFHAFASIAYLWAGKLELEGGVSLLGYSHSFGGFLSTAASMGIATVSFPDLARHLSSSNSSELQKGFDIFKNQLEVVTVFSSFVAIFSSLFVHPIIEALFMRGQFDMSSVDSLSAVLPVYFVDGVFISIMNLTRNVYYSLNKQRLFAIISGLVTLFFLSLSLILSTRVNYIVVGLFETLSMGAFVFISLYFIHAFSAIFKFKYLIKIVLQLLVMFTIGGLIFILYQKINEYNIDIIVSIIICGILYTLMVDIALGVFMKNTIVIEVNRKMWNCLRKKHNGE